MSSARTLQGTTTAWNTNHTTLVLDGEKQGTYIARLVFCLEACLGKLQVTTTTHPQLLVSLERMACLIHESMSVSSRNYHSVQHVFDVAQPLDGDDEDPIAIIAALFHDCVYYHVDGGLSDLQYDKLRGAIVEPNQQPQDASSSMGDGSCVRRETSLHIPMYEAHQTTPCAEDELLCLVEKVFGYQSGQKVTHQNGLNEFLSAVICVRELDAFLPRSILAQIACCIEATIPFRDVDKETGKTCMEKLFENLSQANEYVQLGLSTDERVYAVQRAAKLANSDVANFGTTDVMWFLDNTWSLLPESNEGLRRKYLYTVEQFQFAIFKMYGFFNFLQARVVFPHFQGVPSPQVLAERVANAERNLQVGRKYLGAKLLSLSVLAAFAELTGGDAPISLFMGDLPSRHRIVTKPPRLDTNEQNSENLAFVGGSHPYPPMEDGGSAIPNSDTLNHEEKKNTNETAHPKFDSDAYEVLFKGRRSASFFDVKQSPMAAYLYRIVGDEELEAVLKDVKVYPMTTDVARALLRRLPRAAVTEVSKHMAEVAITRTDKIFAVMETL